MGWAAAVATALATAAAEEPVAAGQEEAEWAVAGVVAVGWAAGMARVAWVLAAVATLEAAATVAVVMAAGQWVQVAETVAASAWELGAVASSAGSIRSFGRLRDDLGSLPPTSAATPLLWTVAAATTTALRKDCFGRPYEQVWLGQRYR